MSGKPRIADLLLTVIAAFFLLAVCLVCAFFVWNLALFLYRLCEVLWDASFRFSWL